MKNSSQFVFGDDTKNDRSYFLVEFSMCEGGKLFAFCQIYLFTPMKK